MKKHDDDVFFVPEELVSEILLRLPAISLLRFKCVCKSWCSTINSPSFKFQHLLHQNDTNNTTNLYLLIHEVDPKIIVLTPTGPAPNSTNQYRKLYYDTLRDVETRCHAPLDPEFGEITITCCCYGLILFDDDSLWNPTTGETKLLPPSPSERLEKRGKTNLLRLGIGFGFDTKSMDYKVVTIYKFLDTTLPTSILFDMYSLKSNSWKPIATYSDKVFQIHNLQRGVFSNGMLSWKAMSGNIHHGKADAWDLIISVDLSSGTIITTPFPSSISHHYPPFKLIKNNNYPWVNYEESQNNYPLVYKESLALVHYVPTDYPERSFDIWILGEYGVKASWTKLFSIGPFQGIQRVLRFWKDGKVIVQTFFKNKFLPQLQRNIREKELLLLDTLSPTQQTTSLLITNEEVEVFTHKDSLVPLTC